MRYIFTIAFLLLISQLYAQTVIKLNEAGQYETKSVNLPAAKDSLSPQLTAFPIGIPCNPSFKNMRNVALCDINNDGKDEILTAINSKLYCISDTGIIWEAALTGTATYPPSVGDLDHDGDMEIIVATGGVPANGRIHAFNHNGTPLAGWPVNFSDHWIQCSPVLADLDQNDTLEIIFCERTSSAGNIQVLKADGSPFGANWPQTLDTYPAITPSVGDINNDGSPEIIAFSTQSRYIFDAGGNVLSPFPQLTGPNVKYSYQSPIIFNANGNADYEICGAAHGDTPQYFLMDNTGANLTGWPVAVAGNNWTYSTPSVAEINGEMVIFEGKPVGTPADTLLFALKTDGSLLSGFPIIAEGGAEGVICIADADNDSNDDVFFGSNMIDANGNGFIHAYSTSSPAELNSFPKMVKGYTYMNGPALGDVNGDGKLDIVSLSYTQNFGADIDSAFINVIELNVPFTNATLKWSTYKGDNRRTGYMPDILQQIPEHHSDYLHVFPNPSNSVFHFEVAGNHFVKDVFVYDHFGRIVLAENDLQQNQIDMSNYPPGIYLMEVHLDNETTISHRILVMD